jgi:hypothetical protein
VAFGLRSDIKLDVIRLAEIEVFDPKGAFSYFIAATSRFIVRLSLILASRSVRFTRESAGKHKS